MKKYELLLLDALDMILAALLLAFTFPVTFFAAILVKSDSPGPVFYKQARYGKDKKVFQIYKFRTMRVDAEKQRPVWGREADPRSSKIGQFLRTTHIDELPQLFNVLKGEMSLVGPRPERPYFAEKFEIMVEGYQRRYQVKPGLTGWSQVNGWRGDSSIEERTRSDIYYIENRSLLFYLKVMLITPFAKPIRSTPNVRESLTPAYILTFSHVAEALPGRIPLPTPIRNA